jgi:drug/metabolite transporter (DMT)-like permease
LAIVLLGEQPNWQTYIGGLLIVAAAVYETIITGKRHAHSRP